jgi:hypothetical protein
MVISGSNPQYSHCVDVSFLNARIVTHDNVEFADSALDAIGAAKLSFVIKRGHHEDSDVYLELTHHPLGTLDELHIKRSLHRYRWLCQGQRLCARFRVSFRLHIPWFAILHRTLVRPLPDNFAYFSSTTSHSYYILFPEHLFSQLPPSIISHQIEASHIIHLDILSQDVTTIRFTSATYSQ